MGGPALAELAGPTLHTEHRKLKTMSDLARVSGKMFQTIELDGKAYTLRPYTVGIWAEMSAFVRSLKGDPIAEPKHEIEKPEELACYPDGKRPATFLLLPEFAARAFSI